MLAVGILALRAMNTPVTGKTGGGLEETSGSQLVQDKELGKLEFVSAKALDQSVFCYPVDGEVVMTFAQTNREVVLEAPERAPVSAVLTGTVAKTGKTEILIENDNGTQTTYQGVVPGVKAGATVSAAQVIGQMAEEKLSLTTVGGIGYVDSLDRETMLTWARDSDGNEN